MEKLFLSYTYRPHPQHEADLERLRRSVVRAVEAMGIRIVDCVDVGGRPLDEALEKRIEDADGLIALMTPQSNNQGGVIDPAFVLSEFQYAEGLKMPTMRVIHYLLDPRGLGAGNEYTPYNPGSELDVILKLMNTIANWIREYGKATKVRLEPADLAIDYDETQGDKCEYQVISTSGGYREYERARMQLEPGAAYVLLPKLREGDRVRVRIRLKNRILKSRYAIDPFVGGVTLEAQS